MERYTKQIISCPAVWSDQTDRLPADMEEKANLCGSASVKNVSKISLNRKKEHG